MKIAGVVFSVLAVVFSVGAEPVWETRFSGERNVLLRDGVEVDFRECVREELRRHPSAQAEDVLKQCFQGAFGPAHILGRLEAARKYFDAEFSSVPPRNFLPFPRARMSRFSRLFRLTSCA